MGSYEIGEGNGKKRDQSSRQETDHSFFFKIPHDLKNSSWASRAQCFLKKWRDFQTSFGDYIDVFARCA